MTTQFNQYHRISLFIALLFAFGFKYPVKYLTHLSPKDWVAPSWADTLNHSMVNDAKWMVEGKVIYANHCLVCHGENGRGDGESGFGLAVPPGDFTDAFTLAESNGALFWKITNGNGSMPSYENRLSETQRWQVVAYLRLLQRNHISSKLNPKK